MKKILIDTHVFLWFINDSRKLSRNAAEILESDIDLLLSIASGKLPSKSI